MRSSIPGAIIFFSVASLASGQRAELGGFIGGGAFGVSSGGSAAAGQAGVQACLFCSGRFGMFAEYGHWFTGGGSGMYYATDRVKSADLAGAGLRIQTRSSIHFFFDVGLVGGEDQHTAMWRGGAIGGAVVGAGVQIPWREHWYLEPQFRVYGLSPHSLEGLGPHWAATGGVGIGYRF